MKIAILGVGNILLKDEGIGVRVVRELENGYTFPPDIAVIDGGTDGPHLTSLVADFDEIIVIDAVEGGENPGTLYRFTLDQISFDTTNHLSIHQMGVLEALNEVKLLGKEPKVTFIGIEPQDISPWGMDLSPVIEEKIPEIIRLVLKELSERGIRGSHIVPQKESF
jgi:hydrogenase maturation protease